MSNSAEYVRTRNFYRNLIKSMSEGKNINTVINVLDQIERRLPMLENERLEVQAGNPFFINQLEDEARNNIDDVIKATRDFYSVAGVTGLKQLDDAIMANVNAGIATDQERLAQLQDVGKDLLADLPAFALAIQGPPPLVGPLIKLPVFKTGRDRLPRNITQDPKTLTETIQGQFTQQKATALGNAKHIDVPYFTTADNIDRLFENNKLQSELNTGSSMYNERMRQWHQIKTDVRYNKYGYRRDPVQIDKPFKNWPANF